MSYMEKDKTRLDEAKERAKEIVTKLPDSSLVFVVDTAEPPVPVGLAPSAALKRIESLAIRSVNRPLNSAMGQVYAGVADCDRPLRVVYVLTDLCRTSWQPEKSAEGLDLVEQVTKKHKGSRIVTFILGVAPKEVANVSLDTAEPSSTVATQGEAIEIRGRIRSQGAKPTTRVVEFTVDGKKKDEKTLEIPPNGEIEVSFTALPRVDAVQLSPGENQAQRRTGPIPRGRRTLLHVPGPAAAEGVDRLRRLPRSPVRLGRARPQSRSKRHASGAGRASAGHAARGSLSRQSPELRRRVPPQCQAARGNRLDGLESLRARRRRARRRARPLEPTGKLQPADREPSFCRGSSR